ncbi:hypothetical protein M9458_007646, partial [Cirrhinus mrigala]
PVPQGMEQTWRRPGPQTPRGPPGHGSPRRTTAGTTAAPTQKRAEESPEGGHLAATVQTPQGAAVASPQAPAAGHTRAILISDVKPLGVLQYVRLGFCVLPMFQGRMLRGGPLGAVDFSILDQAWRICLFSVAEPLGALR